MNYCSYNAMKLTPLLATLFVVGCVQPVPDKSLGYIQLAWDEKDKVDGYALYVSRNGGAFEYALSVPNMTAELRLPPGSYQVYVTAIVFTFESEPSNIVAFKIAGPHNAK